MGRKSCPSAPDMANSGTKAHTMIRMENKQRMVDLVHEELDPLLEGQVGVVARGQVAVDVLDHHDRGIDDDAEIDRPDRQQVRRLAAQEKHREGEQECQGDVDGDNDRGPDIVHEHEQDRDDERDAEAQVLGHGLGGEVEQVGAVVVGLDFRPGQQPAGCRGR